MIQNVKVDIIYYKTPTDFEMEFNLSGCCRMRLLTDKAPDRKILVNQLVRAVTRSRIIMIAGALFGDDGVIETCAKAIGRPTAKLNNSQFGIADDEEINIIKDSIPLVSSEGIFGGCIIEQGPQTLILLSENKNIRKDIMQNLIHSYVKELFAEDMLDSSAEAKAQIDTEIVTEDNEISAKEIEEEIEEEIKEEISEKIITDMDETPVDEDSVEITEDIAEIIVTDELKDDTSIEITEDISKEFIIDSSDPTDIPMNKFEGSYSLADDLIVDMHSSRIFKRKDKVSEKTDTDFEAESYITDDYENSPRLWTGLNIPIIIILALLAVIIGILCYSIFIVPANEGIPAGQYLKEAYNILFG